MRAPLEVAVIGVAVVYCVTELTRALQNGYFPESRVRFRRKVSRENQPGLFWTNFAFISLMLVLGILIITWNFAAPN